MARVILTGGGEDVAVGGSNVEVIGTASSGEVITVSSGTVTFNSSFTLGGDTIRLPGDAGDYTVRSQGARIIFDNPAAGTTVIIPTSDLANVVTFSGGADVRTLLFDTVDGRFELNGVAIGTTPSPVAADAAAVDDLVALVMQSGPAAASLLADDAAAATVRADLLALMASDPVSPASPFGPPSIGVELA